MAILVEIIMQNVNATTTIVQFKMLASVPSALHHNGIHMKVGVAHAVLTVRTIHVLVIKHAWHAILAYMGTSVNTDVVQSVEIDCVTEMVHAFLVRIKNMAQNATCTVQIQYLIAIRAILMKQTLLHVLVVSQIDTFKTTHAFHVTNARLTHGGYRNVILRPVRVRRGVYMDTTETSAILGVM